MSLKIKPQKAKHLYLEDEKKKPAYVGEEYAVFEKHDGWYGYLDFPSCIIHSRAMREIPSLVELSNLLREKRPDCRGRLIFEIMIEGMEIDSFSELNGILNRKYETAEDAYLLVHDYLPEWNFEIPFGKRYSFAEEIVRRLNMPQVRMSPMLALSHYPETWKEVAAEVWQEGREGVILKRYDAPYSPDKRNADLLKIKEELTVEMRVLDVIEGQGDHRGMAGKLLCIDEVNQKHEIGMGAAKHEQRIEYFQQPNLIVGKVVEIKAMKKLKDGSYREPRFKAIRHDKEVHELG
ncbi:putative DNA ligase [Alteromonas phage vB_AmeP_R8W]|uniref:Putative DNA ligase n=1 Tax=Alteromonas phage vB_AmeP_R8W TaxID=2774152 RepID=A0A8E4W5V1_9CAUD|nr:putative DNA ligase [Alteromonas phage vB_AmeP_R8W]